MKIGFHTEALSNSCNGTSMPDVTKLKHIFALSLQALPQSTSWLSGHRLRGNSIKTFKVSTCISGPFSAKIFAVEWIFPWGSNMLKKHLLLQLTATLHTGGVT